MILPSDDSEPAGSAVRSHYDELLGEHYIWMATGGDYEAGVRDSKTMLESFGLACANGAALDLGSGPGIQAVALTRLGYSCVVAVDDCASLIKQMGDANGELVRGGRLYPIKGDLLNTGPVTGHAPFDLVLCVGDTLTHLPDLAAVERLLANASGMLVSGGRLLLRFRDLTQTLTGPDRFIPVRSDSDRIMTCFLEDASSQRVGVTDLIYQRRDPEGSWQLRKSSYHKLRLSSGLITGRMRAHGFQIEEERAERGLVSILAKKLGTLIATNPWVE